jgi:hypothetical protein
LEALQLRRPPIFVVGMQRSGTTLLQGMLGAHPNIAAPPEMHYFFRVVSLADWFGDLHVDENLRRALHETLNPVTPMLVDCGFDEEALYEKARNAPRDLAALLDVVMSDFAQRHGKRRWSEKTPNQAAGAVWALFPDAQVLHIVRDPRDVVASSLRMPWEERDSTFLADHWRRFTLANIEAGMRKGPSHYLLVRYEDLAAAPEPVLRQVCTFLDEPFDDAMVWDTAARSTAVPRLAAGWLGDVTTPVSPFRRSPPGHLSRFERAALVSAVAPVAEALGYGPFGRRAQLVGTVARRVRWPLRLPHLVRAGRMRRQGRTPEGRRAAIRAFSIDVDKKVVAHARLGATDDE